MSEIEVAVGAERSRRAAWAKAYEALRKLRKYVNREGQTHVYFACPCCSSVCEMEVRPFLDGVGDGALEHVKGMHLIHPGPGET